MKTVNEIMLEAIILSVFNVIAVYIAAFTYRLDWTGVLMVMVTASLITAFITHMILSKYKTLTHYTDTVVTEGISVLIIALLSSIAILIILVKRFNLPEALGISLLSGVLSSLVRHLL
jgi:hypothetical protein